MQKILVVFIILLNFMGISYAYWNGNIDLSTGISTGNMNVFFCSDYCFEVKQGFGDLNVEFSDDRTVMYVYGTVSDDYKAFLYYFIKNRGSVPIEYKGNIGKQDMEFIADALEVTVQNLKKGVLEPGEKIYSETGDLKIHIEATGNGNSGCNCYCGYIDNGEGDCNGNCNGNDNENGNGEGNGNNSDNCNCSCHNSDNNSSKFYDFTLVIPFEQHIP